MRHDLGAQRSLLLRAPFAEAFAGFEAELALSDEVLQIRRRSRAVVDIRQNGLVNGEREVGADEVGVLQRPEHRETASEGGLDYGVDGLSIADAALDQRDGLAPQRVLQAI